MTRRLLAEVAAVLFLLILSSAAQAQYFQVPSPYPSPYGRPYGSAPIYGQRCQSQAGLCMMGAPGPVGTSCYCMTPYGPAPGVIVQ